MKHVANAWAPFIRRAPGKLMMIQRVSYERCGASWLGFGHGPEAIGAFAKVDLSTLEWHTAGDPDGPDWPAFRSRHRRRGGPPLDELDDEALQAAFRPEPDALGPLRTTPLRLHLSMEGVDEVGLADGVGCARRGGSVWCWGDNRSGVLTAAEAADGPRVGEVRALSRGSGPRRLPSCRGPRFHANATSARGWSDPFRRILCNTRRRRV